MLRLHLLLLTSVLQLTLGTLAAIVPDSAPNALPNTLGPGSRLAKIKSMYAWEGFVYAIDRCPSVEKLTKDFSRMRAKGARNVITFGYCGTGEDPSYYETVITVAGTTGLNIIPLAWTLLLNQSQTFQNTSMPKIRAVTQAVIHNPGPVLAVALGDEPLYDNDAGSADNLAVSVLEMKAAFARAGLSDIPVSISEMAYGWQIRGDISRLADALDFFMINSFPYFTFDAQSGGSSTSWEDFTNDIKYYEGIAKGKPLLVTQTGWPTNKNQWAPNSPKVVATVASSKAYWDLLDGHCVDYFKPKNIGWMWRNWDDVADGWGVVYNNGTAKWDFQARLTC